MPATPPTDPETNGPSDEALMAALQAGDDAALGPLMERWELGVKSFLLRLGVQPADVEDIAQDAFVRLYETRDRFRPGAAFKPWLLTLAGNLGRNRQRWRARRREESIEAIHDPSTESGRELPDRSAAPAWAALEEKNTARLVRDAVDALPTPLREAVVCVELEELSHQEAAAVLNCSPKAVETRLYRARRRLRDALHTLFAT